MHTQKSFKMSRKLSKSGKATMSRIPDTGSIATGMPEFSFISRLIWLASLPDYTHQRKLKFRKSILLISLEKNLRRKSDVSSFAAKFKFYSRGLY